MAKQIKGVLGEKLGMTQVFDEANRVIPVTVVKAGPCVVTLVRTAEKDGYSAVQLAFGAIDPRKVNKPETGHYRKAGVTPRRHLVELRTEFAGEYEVGQEIGPDVFEAGVKVDVIGRSRGKGTAGVMKRHGFKGLGASHGTQRKHRSPGSIGGCATPGRVFRGLKMAGRMGNERVTTQNLTIHAVDTENGYLLVKGPVPGPIGFAAFGLVVMHAVDLHKNELLSQDQEIDSATSDHRLELIVNVELFQELPELQFGRAHCPHAFSLVLEELGKRCCHSSSKQRPCVLSQVKPIR